MKEEELKQLEEEYNREDLKMRELWGKLKEEEKQKISD